jgi:cellobiose PTS system EIIC component
MAIDDFGMGYTSLRYLMHFKADTIKLDGSLTRYVAHNTEARHIIESISFLSKRQQMHLVAEYVETDAQRKLLQALGCDGFQGYLYSKPLDEANCLQLLHDNRLQAFDMRH